MILRILVCFLLFSSMWSSSVAQTYDLSKLDRLLQDSLQVLGGTSPDDFGGVALLVWKDGRLIYDGTYALPGKTFSKTRLVPIASASKWMSGMVITSMMAQGSVSLDDRVEDYIPSAPADKRAMTLRQLFSFTSGLRGNLIAPTPCVEDLNSKLTLAECVDSVLQQPLATPIGSTLNYGSDGMHVAGRMAEVASGLSVTSGSCWDSLFQVHVARPLGLRRTSFDVPLLFDTDNPRIDGGIFSTAEEYLLLTRMVLERGELDGRRIIAERFIDSMLADQTRGAVVGYSPYFGMESRFPGIRNTRYGIGVWRERVDPETGRALEVASQGRFGFSPWVDFERGYCAVLAVKSSSVVDIYPTYMLIKQYIREAIDAVTSVPPSPLDEGSWNVVGHVDVLGRAVDITQRGVVFRIETNGRRIRTTPLLQE